MAVVDARSDAAGAVPDVRREPAAHRILGRLADVWLGYLGLEQPLTTLSGGERQRLKPAAGSTLTSERLAA